MSTPRTNNLKKLVIDTFGQWHKGEIYAEDVQAILQSAFGHMPTIERHFNEAKTLIKDTVGGLTYLVNNADIPGPQVLRWYEHENKMLEFIKRTEVHQ